MARLGPKGYFIPGGVDSRVHPLVAAVEGTGHAEDFIKNPDPVTGRRNGSVICGSFQPVPGGSDFFRSQAECILGFADPSVFILQFKNESEPGRFFPFGDAFGKQIRHLVAAHQLLQDVQGVDEGRLAGAVLAVQAQYVRGGSVRDKIFAAAEINFTVFHIFKILQHCPGDADKRQAAAMLRRNKSFLVLRLQFHNQPLSKIK